MLKIIKSKSVQIKSTKYSLPKKLLMQSTLVKVLRYFGWTL